MEFKNITLRCDCNAEAVVFTKYNYDDGDKSYGISFEDDYKKTEFAGLFGRFKRAWYAFKSKPVVHMDVFTDDKNKMRKFLGDCLDLITKDDVEQVRKIYKEMNTNADIDDTITSNEELIKEGKW